MELLNQTHQLVYVWKRRGDLFVVNARRTGTKGLWQLTTVDFVEDVTPVTRTRELPLEVVELRLEQLAYRLLDAGFTVSRVRRAREPRRGIFQQGEVLLMPVDQLPGGLKKVKPDGERTVLAYDEVTGHCHAISCDCATQYESASGERYIEVHKGTQLVHDKHDPISLSSGDIFQIFQQREYSPEEIRRIRRIRRIRD